MPIGGLLGAWMDLQNQRNQAQVNLLQGYLNNPQLTNEQRQQIAGQLQGIFDKSGFMSPYKGLHLPTMPAPGPVTQQATPGTAAMAPGSAMNAAPPPGLTGGAPIGPPASPGGPPTGPSIPGGFLREAPSSEAVAPAPEVRGPSQGTQFLLPPSDPMTMPINAQPPQVQQAIQQASRGAWSLIQGMPLGEALQQFPWLRFALQGGAGGTTGPATPGGMVAGQPGAPYGTAQNAPGGPQGAPGSTGGGNTVADIDPRLRGTAYANLPSYAVLDPNTGLPDPQKIRAYEMDAGVAPPTPYETTLEKSRQEGIQQRQEDVRHNAIASRVNTFVNAAKGRNPQQAHALLQKAQDALRTFQQQNPNIDVSDIVIPNSQDIAGPTEGRPPVPRQPRVAGPGRVAHPRQPAGARGPRTAGTQTASQQAAPDRRHQALSARYEGLWTRARAQYPKDVTDALQRIVHGQGTAADNTLVNSPLNTGVASLLQQLKTYYQLLNPPGQTPAVGAPANNDPLGIRP